MFALPAKTPTEDKVVTFDFSGEAATGATLSAPTVTKSLVTGTDAGAASLTIGSATVSGLTVLALVSGGLEGSTYELYCEVTASNGEVHDRAAALRVTVLAASGDVTT